MLLKYGAMADCELGASKDKLTPLMIACSMGRLDIIRLLLKYGANALQRGALLILVVSLLLMVILG
jgi:ankyrin repeat protein